MGLETTILSSASGRRESDEQADVPTQAHIIEQFLITSREYFELDYVNSSKTH